MGLSDLVRNLYGDRFSGLPQDLNRSFGRRSIYGIAQSLMNNPSLMGGLSEGIMGAEQVFDSGQQEFLKREQERQRFESEMANEELHRSRTEQLMELARKAEERAVSDEARAAEDQLMDVEEHGWKEEDRARKIATGKTMAEAFADSPEEIAIYTAMADAGQYNELFSSIMERKFPSVEKWGDPITKPGVGLIQENLRTGEMRVLHHEKSERGDGFGVWSMPIDIPGLGIVQTNSKTGKFSVLGGRPDSPDTYTPNPQQIGKIKIDILEKQLIPRFLKNQKPKSIMERITSAFHGDEAKKSEPMTVWNGIEIPTRLVLEAEESAVKQHVDLYKKAAKRAGAGASPASKPVVGSVSGGPVSGSHVKDFSSRIALENAVRQKVAKDPMYAQLPEKQKKALVDQIIRETTEMIDNGDGTFDEAIQLFLGDQ